MVCWLGCSSIIDWFTILVTYSILSIHFTILFPFFKLDFYKIYSFQVSHTLSLSDSHLSITPFLLHYSLYIYIYIHHLESFHFQINNNNNNSNQLQHQYHQYHQFIFVIIITIIIIKRLLTQSGINWNNEWKKRRRIKSEVSQ